MSNFSGWTKVFKFTLVQNYKKKTFMFVSILVSFLLILASVGTIFYMAYSEAEDKKGADNLSNIKEAIIINETKYDLDKNIYSAVESIKDIKTKSVDVKKDITDKNIKKYVKDNLKDKDDTVSIHIYEKDNTYYFDSYLNKSKKVNESTIKAYTSQLALVFQETLSQKIGLDANQLLEIHTPSVIDNEEVDKSSDTTKELVAQLFPYFCGLILFLLINFNASKISSDVSIEKTSKLVESLLTCIKPFGLITGKILGNICLALLQFLVWIISVIVGLVLGGKIATSVYPDFTDPIGKSLSFIKSTFNEHALSVHSIILCMVFIIMGFVFFSMLAGVAGSIASKPDDLASCNMLYTIPLMIGYFLLIASNSSNEVLKTIVDFAPFSSALQMPGKVIIGSCSMTYALSSLAVLLAFSFLTLILMSKLYKGVIMYNGEKLSIKTMIGIIKGKNI